MRLVARGTIVEVKPCLESDKAIPSGRTGKRVPSHVIRRIYLEHYGQIQKGVHIRHTCGHGWCVEPSHLEALAPRQHYEARKYRRLAFGFNESYLEPAFTYRLRQADGTPADPPSITLAAPKMRVGDTIPLSREETLRVVGLVAGEPALIVEVESESDATPRSTRPRIARQY